MKRNSSSSANIRRLRLFLKKIKDRTNTKQENHFDAGILQNNPASWLAFNVEPDKRLLEFDKALSNIRSNSIIQ